MTPVRKIPASYESAEPGPPTGGLLERPLSARSVMASLLLGMHPPRIRGSLLVRWCALFGISEGTARVALHRMAARGELAVDDGYCSLSGTLAQRQQAQDWSLDPVVLPWRGEWRIAVVSEGARQPTDRRALREAMRRLRLVEFREGVWLRPDNLPPDAAPTSATAVAREQCRVFSSARPDDDARDDLVARFDPQGWAAKARDLRPRLAAAASAIDEGNEGMLAAGFVTGAAALTHVRADPVLPDELLPSPWPATSLRTAYRAYRSAFADATARWFERTAPDHDR